MSKARSFKFRFVALLFAVVFALPIFATFSPKNVKAEELETITVFSWEDYIDLGDEEAEDEEYQKSLLDIFEEETGIHVEYYTFATNEEMYNEIKKNPDACDLVCPSEYMIMKMREEDLIQPYTVPNNYASYASPYIKSVFDGLGLNTEDDKTYAIGYMWGTMGFIYNMDTVTAEELKNWNSIWDNEKLNGKVTIKDSVRDTYIMTLAYVYKDELLALDRNSTDYSKKVAEIFNRTDDDTITKVESALQDLRPKLYGFEVDSGKSDILTGKIDVNFAWSGDAVYSIDEGEAAEKTLGYVVPEEGSNVWFDGWVMTKNADVEKSLAFLDFVSSPYCAIRNMDYIGYVSCIGGADVFDYVVESYGDDSGDYEVDLSYFFDNDFMTTGQSNPDFIVKTSELGRQFSAQYPSYDVIKRCAVMNNFNDETLTRINAMWNRVKLITFSDLTIILIVVGILLLISGGIVFKYRDRIFKRNIPTERKLTNKKGYKVVKIEKI